MGKEMSSFDKLGKRGGGKILLGKLNSRPYHNRLFYSQTSSRRRRRHTFFSMQQVQQEPFFIRENCCSKRGWEGAKKPLRVTVWQIVVVVFGKKPDSLSISSFPLFFSLRKWKMAAFKIWFCLSFLMWEIGFWHSAAFCETWGRDLLSLCMSQSMRRWRFECAEKVEIRPHFLPSTLKRKVLI